MNAKGSASARASGSDLEKVDHHDIQASEYEELPEPTDGRLARATLERAGRPLSASQRVLLSVRYSPAVVDFFRATDKGRQSRIS